MMFPWMKRYLGAGSHIFNEDTQKRIAQMSISYATKFGRAINALSIALPQWGDQITGADIAITKNMAKACVTIGEVLAMVSGRMSRGAAGRSELEKLSTGLETLTSFLTSLSTGAFGGGHFKENIAAFEEMSLSGGFKGLLAEHKQNLGILNRGSKGGAWEKNTGESNTLLKNMGLTALTALVGPAMAPGYILWKMGAGSAIKGGARLLGKGLTSAAGGLGGVFSGLFGGGGGTAGSAATATATGGERGSRSELKGFFGEEAYQTKWTQEVIKLLREMSPKKKSEFNWALLAIAAGIVGIAIAAAKIKEYLEKLLGIKPLEGKARTKRQWDSLITAGLPGYAMQLSADNALNLLTAGVPGFAAGMGMDVGNLAAPMRSAGFVGVGSDAFSQLHSRPGLGKVPDVAVSGPATVQNMMANMMKTFMGLQSKEKEESKVTPPSQPSVYDAGDVLQDWLNAGNALIRK